MVNDDGNQVAKNDEDESNDDNSQYEDLETTKNNETDNTLEDADEENNKEEEEPKKATNYKSVTLNTARKLNSIHNRLNKKLKFCLSGVLGNK